MKNTKLRALVECAVLLALSTVLCIPFLPSLPLGGSVTLCGMIPVILAGWRNGVKWGLVTGFAFGLLQLFVLGGIKDFKGIDTLTVIVSMSLDFFVAFSVLGLGGIFKNRIPRPAISLAVASFSVLMLRYLAHFISGITVFGQWAEWFLSEQSYGQAILDSFSGRGLIAVYSLIYNGLFMVPEIIITVSASLILGTVFKKFLDRA